MSVFAICMHVWYDLHILTQSSSCIGPSLTRGHVIRVWNLQHEGHNLLSSWTDETMWYCSANHSGKDKKDGSTQ